MGEARDGESKIMTREAACGGRVKKWLSEEAVIS